MADKAKSEKREQPVVPVAKKPEPPRQAAPAAKSDKGKADKPKKPNAIARWYRETLGELRKVTWPTPQEAWKLTKVVLIVMLGMSVGLGILDFLFSKGIELLVR